MSADISVHQIEHIYYCQKDESVTMNLKKLNHPKKPTTLQYTSMLMTTLPQITLASRSMRELSPCCPLVVPSHHFFPLQHGNREGFVDRKRQVPSDVKLLLVLFNKSQALKFWPENPSGWINPNTEMISLKPREMNDFFTTENEEHLYTTKKWYVACQ